jgi:hypothetical protein
VLTLGDEIARVVSSLALALAFRCWLVITCAGASSGWIAEYIVYFFLVLGCYDLTCDVCRCCVVCWLWLQAFLWSRALVDGTWNDLKREEQRATSSAILSRIR